MQVVLGGAAGEGGVDLAVGQVQAADGAVADERLPVGGFEALRQDPRRRGGGRVGDQPLLRGDPPGGPGDGVADDDDGDGGAGDGVQLLADLEAVVDVGGHVVVGEALELRLGDAHQHDGFLVAEDVGLDDAPLEIDAHQQVDRLARIGRDRCHLDALEGIADERIPGVDLAHRPLGLGGLEPITLREPFPNL